MAGCTATIRTGPRTTPSQGHEGGGGAGGALGDEGGGGGQQRVGDRVEDVDPVRALAAADRPQGPAPLPPPLWLH